MKKPKYLLNDAYRDGDNTFAAGTELFVFWNNDYVPPHRKAELEQMQKINIHNDIYRMCIIGKFWIPIPNKYITERY